MKNALNYQGLTPSQYAKQLTFKSLSLHISSPTLIRYLVFFIIIESVVAKSFIFDGNDPIIFHYLFGLGSISFILCWLVLKKRLSSFFKKSAVNFTFAINILWVFIITFTHNGILSELSAVLCFTFLILFFYYIFPQLCFQLNLSTRKILLDVFSVILILSSFLLLLYPDLSYDQIAKRYRGILISTAVGCNIFYFSSVYFTWAYKYSKYKHRWIYFVFSILSLYLVGLTLTKSSIVSALLSFSFLFLTNKKGQLIIVKSVYFLSFVIAGFLFFLSFKDSLNYDEILLKFRVLDGNIFASREKNWSEGIERAQEHLFTGTGLLSSQTRGGSQELKVSAGNYAVNFDAHSLPITLVEQGGIFFLTFIYIIFLWVMIKAVRIHGLRKSLQTPEFLILAVTIPMMTLSGGDIVSFGNLINRLIWMFLGQIAFFSSLPYRHLVLKL